ncbi:MAG: hypothetical protein HY791_04560 [Deltaproteobacteria bacterium]|nr:hypothetical protein [Deltaproteobacteria bacterium]
MSKLRWAQLCALGICFGCGDELGVLFELAETATITTLPATVRVRAAVSASAQEAKESLGTIAFSVQAGSSCRIPTEPECDSTSCLFVVEVTEHGICMVRADAFTAASDRVFGCWYIAMYPTGTDYDSNKSKIDEMLAVCEK